MRVNPRDESGQLLLLVLVYALVAAALVMVVTDVSKVYLARRSLAAVADGAALAAAQSIDRAAFYDGGYEGMLRIDPQRAAVAVQAYAERNGLAARFVDFTYDPPQLTDGRTVSVRVHCRVVLPFTGFFTGHAQAVNLDVQASAQSTTK